MGFLRGRAALRNDEAARYAIIERSVQLKLDVVEADPFERGVRRTLNLGHTLGHALEIESGYRLPHGLAVVLGLRAVDEVWAICDTVWGKDMIRDDVIDLVSSTGPAGEGVARAEVVARGARVLELPLGSSALGGSSSAVILVSLPEADALRVVSSMRDGLTPVIRSR